MSTTVLFMPLRETHETPSSLPAPFRYIAQHSSWCCHTVLVESLEDVVRLLGRVDSNSLGCVSVLVTYGDLRERQCIHNGKKLKVKHLFFAFGARGKNGLHARLLRGIRPEGVEIVRKTSRFSLATCPFSL